MDLGIAGKHAVVIGGTSGLGDAAARALAREGVRLTLFARNPKTLASTAASIEEESGLPVRIVAGDITIREDTRRLAASLTGPHAADILVLNTPRPPSPMRDFLDETEDERWEQAYRDQLNGALNVLRSVTPLLVERGWGRIIGITSASVKQPMPRHAISTVFRAGVQAALKHLALEIADRGVTVNAIAPATIITPTFSAFHDVESRVRATPLGRAGTTDEFAGTVAFFASQQAGYITGQVIQLDGGRTASLV